MRHLEQQDYLNGLIENHGFAVLTNPPDDDGPPFAYTIGLTELDHPELIITGHTKDYMHRLLSCLGGHVLEGRDLPTNTLYRYSDDQMVYLLNVNVRKEVLLKGVFDLYGMVEDALQVIVPDAFGCFPWQPGYDQTMKQQQFLAGSPPSLH